MTMQQLWNEAKDLDWCYYRSDDPNVYARGASAFARISRASERMGDEAKEMVEQIFRWHARAEGAKLPPEPGA